MSRCDFYPINFIAFFFFVFFQHPIHTTPKMLRKYSTSCLLESFRLAMGRVSSQAMILTSATSNLNELHGMTLGSVCSLSVFPSPLIQFNLHLPSYTSSELHKHKYLALHVLPPTKNSVHLSRIFAKGVKLNKGAKLAPTKEEKIDGQVFHEMTKPFTRLQKGVDYLFYNISDVQIPILSNVETTLICQTRNTFPVDNHEIWVADVVDIIHNKTQKSGGILYFDRGFHKIGKSLSED